MGDFTSLALDLGSTFGWAIGKNGVVVRSGEVLLSAASSHPGHRWMKFDEWLVENTKGVDEIYYENVTGGKSWQAAVVYGAQLGVLQKFCLAHGLRMCCLKPGQVKKDFTGNGNAKKQLMCNTALNLGWKNGIRDSDHMHNECDAIALLWVIYSRRLIKPSFPA